MAPGSGVSACCLSVPAQRTTPSYSSKKLQTHAAAHRLRTLENGTSLLNYLSSDLTLRDVAAVEEATLHYCGRHVVRLSGPRARMGRRALGNGSNSERELGRVRGANQEKEIKVRPHHKITTQFSGEKWKELQKRVKSEEGVSVQEERNTGEGSHKLRNEKWKELQKRVKSEEGVSVQEERDAGEGSHKLRDDEEIGGAKASGKNGLSIYKWIMEWDRRILDDTVDSQVSTGWEYEGDIIPFPAIVSAEEKLEPKYPQTDGTELYLKNERNGAEVYIVGSSHVSVRSADQVREAIARVKPDFVLVELCRKRYEKMKLNYLRREASFPSAFIDKIADRLTTGNVGTFGRSVGICVAGFLRLLSHRDVQFGQEFQVAIEEGAKVGAKIVLGDQDIDTTMKHLGRFNLNMTMQDAFRFFGQPMPKDMVQSLGGVHAVSRSDAFEQFRDRQVVRRFNEEMERCAPLIHEVLLNERNEIMVKSLLDLEGRVVAVVGLAHLDGMEQLWHELNKEV